MSPMVKVVFAPALQRHVACDPRLVDAASAMEALERALDGCPAMRGYVLDDQGCVRRHVAVFVDGAMACDRVGLSDTVRAGSEIYVVQALSGG
ncbi:MAG: MoaD/ThiS family protein [Rhodocyclaceae bacterium]